MIETAIATATETPVESGHLLSDSQVIDFLIHGYILLRPDFRPGLNEEISRAFDENVLPAIDFENDPYFERLLDIAPGLREVFSHPLVEGAFMGLLGRRRQNYSWYCHALAPGQGQVYWHQDDVNVRHHQVRRLTTMYYPQDVTTDMGPTYVLPSTHFFNTPTDAMQTFGNFRRQVALDVPAGTLAITHYDLWHSASRNDSERMRYMVKLYTDRLAEPQGPLWNHDPERGDGLARNRLSYENPGGVPSSEEYKLRHLRWHAWQYLKGCDPGREVDSARVQGFIGDPRL